MKIVGSILAVVFTFIGVILLLGDLFSGKTGAIFASFIGLAFSGIQGILAIVSFFKPKGAGMGLIVIGGIVAVIALLTSAWFTLFIEALIISSGVLLYKGAGKE